jgi:hypothetical protein
MGTLLPAGWAYSMLIFSSGTVLTVAGTSVLSQSPNVGRHLAAGHQPMRGVSHLAHGRKFAQHIEVQFVQCGGR